MIAGSVVYGLALFACSLAPNIYWFYVLIPLAGATTAFVNNVPVSTIINNWFVEKKDWLSASPERAFLLPLW